MTMLLLALVLHAEPLVPKPPEKLSLLPRAELRTELHAVEDELRELRREIYGSAGDASRRRLGYRRLHSSSDPLQSQRQAPPSRSPPSGFVVTAQA